MSERFALRTPDGAYVTQDAGPTLTKYLALAYTWTDAQKAADALRQYEKALGVHLWVWRVWNEIGPMVNLTLTAYRRTVEAAPLSELPGLYERHIGYDPVNDDHDDGPTEDMRKVLVDYLSECMAVAQSALAPVDARADNGPQLMRPRFPAGSFRAAVAEHGDKWTRHIDAPNGINAQLDETRDRAVIALVHDLREEGYLPGHRQALAASVGLTLAEESELVQEGRRADARKAEKALGPR